MADINILIFQVPEGDENNEFWSLFPKGKEEYYSLMGDDKMYTKSLRLFNFYEVTIKV